MCKWIWTGAPDAGSSDLGDHCRGCPRVSRTCGYCLLCGFCIWNLHKCGALRQEAYWMRGFSHSTEQRLIATKRYLIPAPNTTGSEPSEFGTPGLGRGVLGFANSSVGTPRQLGTVMGANHNPHPTAVDCSKVLCQSHEQCGCERFIEFYCADRMSPRSSGAIP